MLFFDPRDLYSQVSRSRELRQLEESRSYYQHQISVETTELQELRSNPATLEKYAREKYLMKKDNEDLFIVPPGKEQGNN